MRVAILGCGPAGLMAAHGAVMAGASDIRIFSKRRKSELFGAQYLHAPIPLATSGAPFRIRYLLQGTADGYRAKVYGKDWNGTVSPEDLEQSHDGWDIRQTYDWLWSTYAEAVVEFDLNPLTLDMIRNDKPDVIISTVPKPLLCKAGHRFDGVKVWAAGDAPERGKMIPYKQCPPNTVLCNGDAEQAWYRLSHIDGFRTVEWPDYARPPMEAAEVMKPTFTNCDCNSDVLHAGRYGAWEKGVLSHTAYSAGYLATQEALEQVSP